MNDYFLGITICVIIGVFVLIGLACVACYLCGPQEDHRDLKSRKGSKMSKSSSSRNMHVIVKVPSLSESVAINPDLLDSFSGSFQVPVTSKSRRQSPQERRQTQATSQSAYPLLQPSEGISLI